METPVLRGKKHSLSDLGLLLLSTKWVDYVEEPMKYQALRPKLFSMGGWGVVGQVVVRWVGVGRDGVGGGG